MDEEDLNSELEHRLKLAHKHSSLHRGELMNSAHCRCFYCMEQFPTAAIQKWVDKRRTALCPKCGIDSVIGDASGISFDDEFFGQMKWYWFER